MKLTDCEAAAHSEFKRMGSASLLVAAPQVENLNGSFRHSLLSMKNKKVVSTNILLVLRHSAGIQLFKKKRTMQKWI